MFYQYDILVCSLYTPSLACVMFHQCDNWDPVVYTCTQYHFTVQVYIKTSLKYRCTQKPVYSTGVYITSLQKSFTQEQFIVQVHTKPVFRATFQYNLHIYNFKIISSLKLSFFVLSLLRFKLNLQILFLSSFWELF